MGSARTIPIQLSDRIGSYDLMIATTAPEILPEAEEARRKAGEAPGASRLPLDHCMLLHAERYTVRCMLLHFGLLRLVCRGLLGAPLNVPFAHGESSLSIIALSIRNCVVPAQASLSGGTVEYTSGNVMYLDLPCRPDDFAV